MDTGQVRVFKKDRTRLNKAAKRRHVSVAVIISEMKIKK